MTRTTLLVLLLASTACGAKREDTAVETDTDTDTDTDLDEDEDGWTAGEDCDDHDAAVSPDAAEICLDGVDNNCDGVGAPAPGEPCSMGLGSSHAKLLAEAAGDKAAYSLAHLGDDYGDGGGDVLVGASFAGDAGAAYLVVGPLSGDVSLASALAVLRGESSGDELGARVASAGDLDGDGFVDTIMGAVGADGGGESSGAAFVFYGPLTGEISASEADGTLWGASAGDAAGDSLAAVGDVDGDGVPDLVVGASNSDHGGENLGGAWLVRGPASGTTSLADAEAHFVGEADFDNAGNAVAALGDTDGDGFADFAIGAPHRDDREMTSGTTYVLLGPVSGTIGLADADGVVRGEDLGGRAGGDLAGGEDVNGDGLPDLVVGAHSTRDTGAVYIVWGPATGTSDLADAPVQVHGDGEDGWLGARLDFAGDMDGDGNAELAVGAKLVSRTGTDAGAAYVFFGPFVAGSRTSADAELEVLGEAAGDEAGMDIAPAGDLTGDGLDDLVVGARYESTVGEDGGAAYVVSIGGP